MMEYVDDRVNINVGKGEIAGLPQYFHNVFKYFLQKVI